MAFFQTVWMMFAKVGEKEIPDSRVVHIKHTVRPGIYLHKHIHTRSNSPTTLPKTNIAPTNGGFQ